MATLYALFNGQNGDGHYAIGAATRTAGTWSEYASNPVLTFGTGWESHHVKDPWLMYVSGQYVMYYSGYDGTNYRIGRATASSHEGPWTKYASNPVLTLASGGAFDDATITFPTVLYEPTDTGREWKLWYIGNNSKIGYAYSSDGLSFTKYSGNPVVSPGTAGAWDDEGVGLGAIYKEAGTYYMFVSGRQGTTNPQWQGGVVTFTDPEGTYTKYAGNPTLLSRYHTATATQQPLADVSANTVSLTTPSAFNVGEAVIIADGAALHDPEVFYVTAVGGGTVTLDHFASFTYQAAGGVFRSFAFNSVTPRTVLATTTGYEAFVVPFQPVEDLTVPGSKLYEGSFEMTASALTGAWSYNYVAGRGVLFPLQTGAAWHSRSAENISAVDIAAAVASAPEPGVWVDWGQDGFDDGSAPTGTPDHPLARAMPEAGSSGTVNDNITSDVIAFNWTRGAASDHVAQPSPGQCTIIVQNDDGKYTPENSSSVLYGKLRPGLPVWIGRNADGTLSGSGQTVYGIWAGYVRQIVPIPGEAVTNTATAEIICEDPLGYYSTQPTKVEGGLGRSYTELRTAVLDDIGEDAARRDLADEVDTLPFSSADSENALSVLEEINRATASRHWIEPADDKSDWYFYTTRTRHHKLTSATDFALNADNVQSSEGYRVTAENVVNFQEIDVSPARFPAGSDTIWTYAEASFPLTAKRTIWAQFDDFVTDAVLDYTSTGGAVTTTLTNFGTTAKIDLWSGSSSVVANLTIEGRQLIRDASEAVTAEDAASQVAYGKRAGSTVSSEYSSTTALAQGVADFITWRFSTAHPRMTADVTNLFSTLNGRTLYDTLGLTFDRLYLTGKRFEIIGEEGACSVAASAATVYWTTNYELQETANQSALALFTFDSSVFDGSDVLAR